jgi:predicted peroxiredoxin
MANSFAQFKIISYLFIKCLGTLILKKKKCTKIQAKNCFFLWELQHRNAREKIENYLKVLCLRNFYRLLRGPGE